MSYWVRRLNEIAGLRSSFHIEHKKLLVSSGSMTGVDKIPIQKEYEIDLKDDVDINKKIVKLGELKELSCEDLFFPSITIPLW